MYKDTTDLSKLGSDYNVIGEKGELIKVVNIIKMEDILSAGLGEYNESFYKDYREYLNSSIKRLSGFVRSPLDVYWHMTTKEDYEIIDVIEKCVNEEYNHVIVEIISDESIDKFLN